MLHWLPSRRDLVRQSAALALAAVAGSGSAGETAKPEWKTAVGLNGFLSSASKYKKHYPIWEILHNISGMGFDGIELVNLWPSPGEYYGSDEKEKIAALRRMYEGFGLRIFSIQLFTPDAFSPDDDRRKRWLDLFADRARLARSLGCDCVGMWPGGALGQQTLEQALERLGRTYAQAARIAAEQGLTAAFEIEPPFVFNREEHIRGIFAAAGDSPLKMIYDPSHFDLMNGSTGRPHELLERVGVRRIGYLHLTDTDGTLRDGGTSKHLACGDGHANIPASLKLLRDGGFSGWIMIDAWEIPDVYDAASKGKKMIDAARA